MDDLIKQTVRDLRKNQTPSEARIWKVVRNRKLNGKKFLRQHPILFEMDGRRRFFVADFYAMKKVWLWKSMVRFTRDKKITTR